MDIERKGHVWNKVAYESNLILCKTPQGIAEECKGIIELMSLGGGFLMGTACIDPGTPVENLRAIISASKKFGKYRG